jgi:membrane protein YqaA with SNARE-associated domain
MLNMSDVNRYHKQTGAEKGGWVKRKLIPLLILFLVIAITVCLFLYRDELAQLGNYGYLSAFLISLITNATIILPFPGIVIILLLGATFNPVLVGLAGGIGGAIGEMTCYMLGYSGRGVVENRRFYDKAAQWLKKWGVLTVFVFALTPLPFDVLGIAAGLLRFPLWKFFVACWCGKTLVYIGMALAGAWGWEAFVSGMLFTSPVAVGILAALGTLALLVLALVIENWTWKRGR